jgi:predicted ATPase
MLQVLLDHLRVKRLLLILDNCEHLVPACGRLADALLRACTDVRILTTSRQPLGVDGEMTYEVTPLDLPDPRHLPPLHQLSDVSAIKLFVDRAMASLPSFAITVTNATAVVHTCRRLDGIPLALELAAARIKAISVEQLAQRLDDTFWLLSGGGATKLPHHQTLQAMMDWSYDLLTDRERRVFRSLSVFAGGFTLDAAEQVCAVSGQARDEVFELLSNLVDKSLIAVDRDRDLRYRLLEPIRMYAEDKLRQAEEHRVMRDNHLEYFAALAERVETTLWTGEHKRGAAVLDAEHDNLRAGLAWARSGEGPVDAGLRLAAALGWFWYVRGYSLEARRWLEDLVPRRGAAAPRVQVRSLNRAGLFAWHQGDYDHAVMRCNEGLELARQLGDKGEVAFALSILGMTASQPQGAYARATRLLSESLTLAQEIGDRWTTAMDLHHLGRVSWRRGEYARAQELLEQSLLAFKSFDDDTGIAYAKYSLGLVARDQGDYARAVALQEESLALMAETGDRIHYTVALNSLGILARLAGDYVKAAALAEESLRQFREYGDKPGVGLALYSLAMALMHQGESRKAGEVFRQSIAVRVDVGDRRAVAEVLEGMAALAALDREPERGARLLGMAQALREAVGAPVPAALRQEYERTISVLRAALGPERFETAVLEGQRTTLKEAVSFAAQETRPEPEV